MVCHVFGFANNAVLFFVFHQSFSPEAKMYKRAIELNQGRAAMMGLLGLMVHEKLNEIGMVADLPIIGVLK